MANGAWKIARRGNAQLPLVIVVALAVVLVLLGKAQAGLFDRARMRITDWMQPMLESVHAPVQLFNRWMGSAGEIFHVYQENLALKDENARLKQWRNVAVVMQGRVAHYQSLLHAVPDPDVNSVMARVIGRATRPFLETMILDAGTDSGVKPGEAVVDARGMIGRIYLAGGRTSWVILLTDLNSRIPVTIAASAAGKQPNTQAIMAGDNTAMPALDTLSPVTLEAGDQVVSSGDGGLLPPGLPIGTVVATPGGYRVALLAEAASSQDVEVLAFRKPPESLPAPTDTQLPAVAAGLAPIAPPPPAPPSTLTSPPASPPAAAAKTVPTAQAKPAGTLLPPGPAKPATAQAAPAPGPAKSAAAKPAPVPGSAKAPTAQARLQTPPAALDPGEPQPETGNE